MEDNGVGIPPENMNNLFEPLFTTKLRRDRAGTACQQETGGGERRSDRVQSQPGKGSTFTLWLPVYSPSRNGRGLVNSNLHHI